MTNSEKYREAFLSNFDTQGVPLETLHYQDIPSWDSVGHMSLITAIEDAFDIMFDTEDIIEFDSYEKGKEILSAHYGITF